MRGFATILLCKSIWLVAEAGGGGLRRQRRQSGQPCYLTHCSQSSQHCSGRWGARCPRTRAGNGGFVSFVGRKLVPVGSTQSLCGRYELSLATFALVVVRANPDAPLATPHRAELHKPTQGLIRAGHGGFASQGFRKLVPTGST
jgi:hypothetical protein